MFCFKIIICLVLGLLLISSDFSEVGGHLYNLPVNLASDWGLPDRYFSIPSVSSYLAIAPSPVIKNPSAVYAYVRALLVSLSRADSGTHTSLVPCSSRSREPTPALTPAYAFSSCEIKDFYVAIIMFVPCSSRSREPTPALTPAYAFFLWPCPPVHTVRSFSGNLSLDARTFLTL